MKARDKIIRALGTASGPLCDDCLSGAAEVHPRQQVHQRASELGASGEILREKGTCSGCRRFKLVNSTASPEERVDGAAEAKQPAQEVAEQGRAPWYWEGNVQSAIVTHLTLSGYKIQSVSRTATKEPGKDIEAIGPDGKKLWVSVKGWPERSQNTQARHWFSGVLFDMILYHEEDPSVGLAIGLPAGHATYESLWQRVSWFRSTLSLRAYWVHDDGRVTETP